MRISAAAHNAPAGDSEGMILAVANIVEVPFGGGGMV
jgi:hypothetical protein